MNELQMKWIESVEADSEFQQWLPGALLAAIVGASLAALAVLIAFVIA